MEKKNSIAQWFFFPLFLYPGGGVKRIRFRVVFLIICSTFSSLRRIPDSHPFHIRPDAAQMLSSTFSLSIRGTWVSLSVRHLYKHAAQSPPKKAFFSISHCLEEKRRERAEGRRRSIRIPRFSFTFLKQITKGREKKGGG